MRLLLVEDDLEVGSLVKEALEAESYALDWAKDGREALSFAQMYPYDLIVLDVMLPYADGFSIVAKLRSTKNRTPILMLTARDALEDRVKGLELGADDYVLKPFALAELRARVRALLRRSSGEAGNEVEVGRLRLDLSGRQVWWKNQAINLTGREYALLEFLALHTGGYYPRETLMEHVWPGDSSVGARVVDPYIRYLRRKLGDDAIETVKGLGYTFRG
jgi:two-component system OmpR family response regulator/two-component system response regulator QseB